MLEAYFHAGAALNHLRTHPVAPTDSATRMLVDAANGCPQPATARLLRDIAGLFPAAAAAPPGSQPLHSLTPVLRSSQEALILAYEHALTRHDSDGRWWDGSTHLLWIGEWNRDPGHAQLLPALMTAASDTGTPVCWICDPMRANIRITADYQQSYHLDDVTVEIRAFFGACRRTRTNPGGLHLETASEHVAEERLDHAELLQCVGVAVQELRLLS
jgi:3-deoxy-D-arabino-heptulosonate 7-phosphate (DAHP) synthase class II